MAKRENEWKRFRVIKQLGAGAFGRTLLVTDTSEHDRQVVIKVPHDKKTEEALINDIINASSLDVAGRLEGLSHPNIVRYLGFAKYDDYFVLIMEYVKGKDLRQMIGPAQINSRKPMDIESALRYFRNACAGLVEAHKIKLLHRDIKPDNIIVQEKDDVAKLLDFGISKVVQSASAAGTVTGTFPYMAPEALNGKARVPSDLWSLSVTLYELITGRLPFWDDNLFELKRKIDHDDPVAPRSLNPNVDSRLSDLTIKGLDKDPNKRFHTAEEMLKAFFPVEGEIDALRKMFNDGREADAESGAEELLKKNSSEAALYMLIGEFRNRHYRFAQAEDILRKGISVRPNHAGLHFYLAPALFYQGREKRQEGVVEMEKAIKLGLLDAQHKQAENLLKSWSKTK